ncbi:MAG: GYD domain-containing protein [Xanthobacteraceae bacterium]
MGHVPSSCKSPSHSRIGEYDVVAIAEFPDNAAAAAFALGTASKGAVSKFHTTVLLTAAEGLRGMRKAQQIDYAPPVM